jgi:hypothetical protein
MPRKNEMRRQWSGVSQADLPHYFDNNSDRHRISSPPILIIKYQLDLIEELGLWKIEIIYTQWETGRKYSVISKFIQFQSAQVQSIMLAHIIHRRQVSISSHPSRGKHDKRKP